MQVRPEGPARHHRVRLGTAKSSFIARATLSNGLRVAVRTQFPTDAEQLVAGFAQLSEESRYRRFMAGKPHLTPHDLRHLVDGVDQRDHIALVMVWPRTSRPDIILGDAHAIRLPAQPDTADVAVTVADEIRGLGAGRTLIHALGVVAQRQHITHFTATILSTNTASQRMLASAGTVIAQDAQGSACEMTVRLHPPSTR